MDNIYFGCNCKNCDIILLNKFDDKKFIPITLKPNIKVHENMTINALLHYAKTNKNTYVLYLHSKGVTSDTAFWRNLMNYWNIIRHKDCFKFLDKGFYTVGINMRAFNSKRYYAGNFWWANTNYIRSLDKIQNIYDRMNAETFILSKPHKYKHISLHGPYLFSNKYLQSGLYKRKLPKILNKIDKNFDIKIL